MIRRANAALSQVYPIAKYLDRNTLNQLYCTYIRPLFDYGDILYDGHITTSDILRLERFQMRAARLVTGALFRTPSEMLLKDVGWERLKTRREVHKLTYFYNLVDIRSKAPDFVRELLPDNRQYNTDRTLRNAHNLTQPQAHLASYKASFIPSLVDKWNQLPSCIRNLPTSKSFKEAVAQRLCSPKPPHYYECGSKLGNIRHTRLRLGMSYLNAHLFSIHSNKVQSPECSCGFEFENTSHFIFSCPKYQNQRNHLAIEMQNILINYNTLREGEKLDILLHGKGLGGAEGWRVATAFQSFIRQRFQ